jgi:hypothetical protein
MLPNEEDGKNTNLDPFNVSTDLVAIAKTGSVQEVFNDGILIEELA